MYEQTFNFWDLAIAALFIGAAGYYLYRKIVKKKNICGSDGCDSCPSSSKGKSPDS